MFRPGFGVGAEVRSMSWSDYVMDCVLFFCAQLSIKRRYIMWAHLLGLEQLGSWSSQAVNDSL